MKLVDDRPDQQKKSENHEILGMKEGYYNGDKPNPNLRKFVENHMREHPYDPAKDDYNVPAFNKPLESTKSSAVYNMHTYWSKKPHDAIRQYIQHYTKPGDLVLDPFCGSGGTAVAALIDGRAAIAIDRSPAATFITSNYCTPVKARDLEITFEELKAKVTPEIDWLYETRCDRCGGKATTAYTVYSHVFQCPRCMAKVPLFDCIEIEGKTDAGKSKKISVCPHCHSNGHEEEISTRSKRFGTIPVLVNYYCLGKCKPSRNERRHNDSDPKKREYFEKYDIRKVKEIEENPIPHWIPPHKMMNVEDDSQPWGDCWRPGRNFRKISELFTKRNLWALSTIRENAQHFDRMNNAFLFCLSAILISVSKMYLWTKDGQHGIISGTYYLPQTFRETNVWLQYPDKIKSLINLQSTSQKSHELCISTSSVISMDIPSDSVDFIFTDPPYGGKFQYGELNFLWEAWLDLDTKWQTDEIIINEFQKKTEADWAILMQKAMNECYRVLKPGRWLSLCYHDTSEGTWGLIQDILAESGFIFDNTESSIYIDSKKKTFNQYNADKVTKRDLVINFRKPRLGEISGILTITGDEDATTFSQKVVVIIRDFLTVHPGTTKDRIYDEVVSRMVRAGQMEAHNFEDLLKQVAEPVAPEGSTGNGVRWYLKETELNAVDIAETNKEDAAAEKVGAFITTFLQKNPEQEGVHYSDIFEHFIYTIKDKPRRTLAEWLLDYFYKTGEGTFRLPVTDAERQVKKEGRAKGIARKIKHYIVHLEQNIPLPVKIRPSDATIAEWIHHCRRAGMYEQGKILYEKGGIRLDGLTDEQQAAVEEDYDVCARLIARGGEQPAAQPKKGRKNKDIVNI